MQSTKQLTLSHCRSSPTPFGALPAMTFTTRRWRVQTRVGQHLVSQVKMANDSYTLLLLGTVGTIGLQLSRPSIYKIYAFLCSLGGILSQGTAFGPRRAGTSRGGPGVWWSAESESFDLLCPFLFVNPYCGLLSYLSVACDPFLSWHAPSVVSSSCTLSPSMYLILHV